MKVFCGDVETTGLDPRYAEIVELSYQTWENGKRSAMINHVFCAQGDPAAPAFVEAVRINGYDAEARKKVPTLRYWHLKECFAAIDACGGIFVGANPAFDWAFLKDAAERMCVPLPKERVRLIDVSSLAVPHVVLGKAEGFSLRQLAKLVGKTQGDASTDGKTGHTSKQDVELTLDVFEFLCKAYVKAAMT